MQDKTIIKLNKPVCPKGFCSFGVYMSCHDIFNHEHVSIDFIIYMYQYFNFEQTMHYA